MDRPAGESTGISGSITFCPGEVDGEIDLILEVPEAFAGNNPAETGTAAAATLAARALLTVLAEATVIGLRRRPALERAQGHRATRWGGFSCACPTPLFRRAPMQ